MTSFLICCSYFFTVQNNVYQSLDKMYVKGFTRLLMEISALTEGKMSYQVKRDSIG